MPLRLFTARVNNPFNDNRTHYQLESFNCVTPHFSYPFNNQQNKPGVLNAMSIVFTYFCTRIPGSLLLIQF